jgi:arylsulfate sulfotransferase
VLTIILACQKPSVEPPAPTQKPVPTSPAPQPADPVSVEQLRVERPESDAVRQAQRLLAVTDRPARAVLTLDHGEQVRRITFPELATEHDLPLLGLLADTDYTVTVTFTAEDGGTGTGEVTFDSGPTAERLPVFELLASDPARMEPGYRVFPVELDSDVHLVAVDAQGRPVWSWSSGGFTTRALAFSDGVFSSLVRDGVVRLTPLGELVNLWVPQGFELEGAVTLPLSGLHHEVTFEPDGSFWSFHKRGFEVEAYPSSEEDPTQTAPARIADDLVVHVAPDGTVLHEWSLAERLDPTRIGFGSLDANGGGGDLDWAHANAIVPLPDGSGILVSLRHQDTIVKLSYPDGALEWILANPDGWTASLAALRLQPADDGVRWPYHQHAPMLTAEGRLLLFDNGNDRRTTPYSQQPDPGGLYSRVVELEIDEASGTVRQTFETRGAPYSLYSQALGNADELPVTGNVLATFSFLHQEDDIDNTSIGDGELSTRIVEVERSSGATVWDLRVSTPEAAVPGGLLCDRAIHVPSLYPQAVLEEILP